jgi:hypothetical protein
MRSGYGVSSSAWPSSVWAVAVTAMAETLAKNKAPILEFLCQFENEQAWIIASYPSHILPNLPVVSIIMIKPPHDGEDQISNFVVFLLAQIAKTDAICSPPSMYACPHFMISWQRIPCIPRRRFNRLRGQQCPPRPDRPQADF